MMKKQAKHVSDGITYSGTDKYKCRRCGTRFNANTEHGCSGRK